MIATVDGCDSETSNEVHYDLSTGVLNANDFADMLYPNPAEDVLYVRSARPIESIEVRDALGALVLLTRTSPIDLSAIAPGVYHVQVNTNGGSIDGRIVVR